MKRFSALRVLFVFCACCVGNTILFQTPDAAQGTSEAEVYQHADSMFEIVLGLILPDTNTNDEEINDLTEGEEFLSSRPIIFHCSFGLDTSKSKITIQQNMLHNPFLEKSTPPPKYNS